MRAMGWLPLILLPISTSYLASFAANGAELTDSRLQIKLGYVDREHNVRSNDESFKADSFFLQGRYQQGLKLNSNWSAYLDGRVLVASDDETLVDEETLISTDLDDNDNVSAELRQAYVAYHGLTQYPNESLRFGLQRLREYSGLWWDADIESITWQASTTELEWLFGIGQQFDRYRTDADLPEIHDDVFRVFASGRYHVNQSLTLAVKLAHASQSNDNLLPLTTNSYAAGVNGERTWFGAELSRHWQKSGPAFGHAFKLEAIFQTGQGDMLTDAGIVSEQDNDGYALDAGYRFDFRQQPLSIGMTATIASGGDGDTFSQSGIHSNRSHHYGNSETLYRFNEALRADMSNLRHWSIFGAYAFGKHTRGALAISRFQRDDENQPIYVGGRAISIAGGDKDLGMGIDLSITHFPQVNWQWPIRFIRLRASTFNPTGELAQKSDDHRFALEAQFVL
ncbi:alginate export family protein [Aestuariibacter sp. AA17]|uniref:Alginate export family protein n=1 Tax=Fluctibacter corallii TaxID=2984329 RepID=A0ABT3A8A3_9ALTE|nr:alginate export family protein [Aestuariibacter sp. AA17]MCV2884909.1 alginate export family protein [Aestuariibacter sp. AA17]